MILEGRLQKHGQYRALAQRWLLVASSADFATVGPTVACQPLLRLDISIFCRRWANGGFLFKLAVSHDREFWET